MKKLFVKISLVFGIIAALVLVLLILRSLEEDAPSYSFIASRNPITCKKGKSDNEDIHYTYSFEADFNDFCLKVDAELIPAGFVADTSVSQSSIRVECREYRLQSRFPRGPVWIVIFNDVQFKKSPNSKEGSFSEKDGWVMIKVIYGRGWRWPF